MAIKKQKRGAYRREDCVFIGTWIPASWISKIEAVVQSEDTDRSKIVRKALEQKLQETT
jgi:metal-responsive CopG/Arc/MetJ family transcriptional regulator